MGTGSFPGVKRPGRDVDHPPLQAPRLEKEQSYTSAAPLGFHGLFYGYIYLYPYKFTSHESRPLKAIVLVLLVEIFSPYLKVTLSSLYTEICSASPESATIT
jgi:hypothetical protein